MWLDLARVPLTGVFGSTASPKSRKQTEQLSMLAHVCLVGCAGFHVSAPRGRIRLLTRLGRRDQ